MSSFGNENFVVQQPFKYGLLPLPLHHSKFTLMPVWHMPRYTKTADYVKTVTSVGIQKTPDPLTPTPYLSLICGEVVMWAVKTDWLAFINSLPKFTAKSRDSMKRVGQYFLIDVTSIISSFTFIKRNNHAPLRGSHLKLWKLHHLKIMRVTDQIYFS